jgi:hypothetical protein
MRALGACSCSFNGFSFTTPLTTTITPRATTVGLKDTLDGRPDPTQIRSSFSFAMPSFTRTAGLLLMTHHALEDKAMTCYPFHRSLKLQAPSMLLDVPCAYQGRQCRYWCRHQQLVPTKPGPARREPTEIRLLQ